MVVAFKITEINYSMVSIFCNVVRPLLYLYLRYYVLWLRHLPCFRHSDKSSYGFPEFIHNLLVGVHLAEMFLKKMCSVNSVLQIIKFMVLF